MKKILLLTCISFFVFFANGYSQDPMVAIETTQSELKGTVLDVKDQLALPYVNILILRKHKGTITNENGAFLIGTSGLQKTDTIRFQYIGYKIKDLSVGQLMTSSTVLLEEDVYAMDEVFVVSEKSNAEAIVKEVLKNKEVNYRVQPRKEQVFIRSKYVDDIEQLEIDYKKNDIEGLEEETLRRFQEKIPKQSISYDDFLGVLYSELDENGERKLKIDPIKKVKLKSKEIAEVKQFEAVFKRMMNETGDKEYWKIKSGIFGSKLDMDDATSSDTKSNNENDDSNKAGGDVHTEPTKGFRDAVKNFLTYSTFEDKELWEFLYKTNSYEYNLEGGTTMNGEDVYVIDFTPKRKGHYEGRLYISIKTSALIRADYKFAPNKTGKDFHLLGVSYVHTYFGGSIYFEKIDDSYVLKYFSHKSIESFGVERGLALQKKKNRFLFDKKLKEFKINLKLKVKSQVAIEYLVKNTDQIPSKTFADFKEKEKMEVIFVDQFNDELWKGYSVIEPTKCMKEYKKIRE